MIRIKLLLDNALQGAIVSPNAVRKEVERISIAIGRDFTKFIRTEDDQLIFVAPEGALSPKRWNRLLPYGPNPIPNPEIMADSPEGFALFFLTATTLPLLSHQQTWADHCWKCWNTRISPVIIASRGFGKSIFMRNLMAYGTGLYPHLENLIIRVADAPARKAAEGIANIIVNNPAWKLWFPEVMPKSRPGQAGGEWSAGTGYSVIDITVPEDEWALMEASRTSPTISKFGIGGAGVLGSRTSNLMLADDLHRAGETPNETETIKTRFISEVEPTRQPTSRLGMIGTPWNDEDLTQTLPESPQYNKIETPITIEGTWPGTPTCPEIFNADAIQALWEADTSPGKREFMKNRLLKLVGDFDKHFSFRVVRLYEDHWFHRIGNDYAAGEGVGPERSYYALVVIAQHPESGVWVIIDGIVARVTQSQAERLMHEYYNKYKNVEAVSIEEAAGGKEFMHILVRSNPSMPIWGVTPGSESKERRWEMNLEPMFAGERVVLLDKEYVTDTGQAIFLSDVERALKRYPDIRKRGDKAADILDAIYYAVYHALIAFADPVRQIKKRPERKHPFRGFVEAKL
jgi:hypothetical protein